MIYTITFNPSLDYVLKVPELSIGKINRSENEKIYIGGKGINVSRVLNTLGMKSIPLGFIAGFTGRELKNKLIEYGIEPEFIELREGKTRVNIKIKGEVETAINADGPNINDYSIALLLKQIDDLDSNDIVILAGYVPKSIDSSIYALICKKLYDKNIPFIVDTSGKHLIDSLKYNPFLIKPNKEELEECLGYKIESIDDLKKGIKKLQELGALNVLVSLGADGAFLIDDQGNEYGLTSPSISVVNTVGAGDSMVAGFIYGFLKNRDYKEALIYGVACGSATAQCDDLATIDKIELMLDKINN